MWAMPTRNDKLSGFVRSQSADVLADVLLELAVEHPEVQQRLKRLQLADQPAKLAATFRRTLTGWRRQTRFLDYGDARRWVGEIWAWLEQVEQELLPRDPAAVVALAEALIESDGIFLERVDDSGGSVASVIQAGCRLWLQAAARCESPANTWPDRLRLLYAADEYGTREPLLQHANMLLSEGQLRELVSVYEMELDASLPASDAGRGAATSSFCAHAALTLLSAALRDPDVHVRATLRRSPTPNSMQKQDFVLLYLHADRAADALPWLEDPADWHEQTRLRLLAEVMKCLGHTEQSAPMQQQVFEQTLRVDDFRTWLEHLAPHAQAGATARARQLALDHDDPVAAASLLVELQCWDDAERSLVAEPARIDGRDYGFLVPLAAALEAHGCLRGATAVYRSLLDAILAKAYAPAYRHAARYWHRLSAIAAQGGPLLPLQPHADYVSAIRKRHARKVAFWAQVQAGESAAADDADERQDWEDRDDAR